MESGLALLCGDGHRLAGVDHADVDALVATMMEPRWDTRRCTMMGPVEGAGALAAQRAPRSRCRSRSGTGQRSVRSSSPSWLMTAIWCGE
jgi:hypothetical protein